MEPNKQKGDVIDSKLLRRAASSHCLHRPQPPQPTLQRATSSHQCHRPQLSPRTSVTNSYRYHPHPPSNRNQSSPLPQPFNPSLPPSHRHCGSTLTNSLKTSGRSYPSDCLTLSDLAGDSPLSSLGTTRIHHDISAAQEQHQLRRLRQQRVKLGTIVAEQFCAEAVEPELRRRYWSYWRGGGRGGQIVVSQRGISRDTIRPPSIEEENVRRGSGTGSSAFQISYTSLPSASAFGDSTVAHRVSQLLFEKEQKISELKTKIHTATKAAKSTELEISSLRYERNAATEYEAEASANVVELSALLELANSGSDLLEVELEEQEHRLYVVQRCWLKYINFYISPLTAVDAVNKPDCPPITHTKGDDLLLHISQDLQHADDCEIDEVEASQEESCDNMRSSASSIQTSSPSILSGMLTNQPQEEAKEGGRQRPMPPSAEWNLENPWFRLEEHQLDTCAPLEWESGREESTEVNKEDCCESFFSLSSQEGARLLSSSKKSQGLKLESTSVVPLPPLFVGAAEGSEPSEFKLLTEFSTQGPNNSEEDEEGEEEKSPHTVSLLQTVRIVRCYF